MTSTDGQTRPSVPGRPTMKDVAAYAGVALKTVSRVVNGEPGVSPGTMRRVLAAIDQLGFRRNDSARLLRKGQTASIGLILEDIGNPFYSGLSRTVEDVARDHGSLLFIGSSDEDPERERELALAFCARRVDGLVIIPASDDHTYLLPEITAGTAMVFVDRPARRIEADAVLSDNVGGAREGVGHLIRQGHQRIGFIGDSPHIYTAMQRFQGYREAMSAAGLKIDDSWIAMAQPTAAGIEEAVGRMVASPKKVTALFCGNNRISVLALRELSTIGRSLALVGFDDFELAELVVPGITVVAQDVTEMGRIAAEMLLRRISGESGQARRVELATRLIPRGSGEIPPQDEN
jgi:LacI family transcriptional regulator, galactose operon repressor